MENTASSGFVCHLCRNAILIENLYILDECDHRFCRKCLEDYINVGLRTGVNVSCPLVSCQKQLSYRNLEQLLPKKKANTSVSLEANSSSGKATERIMSELKHILKSSPEKNGFSIKPSEDNIYLWNVKLFNFDWSAPLQQDMKFLNVDFILLEVVFPSTYPFAPPFIRVIKPRFKFRTGHVTIGGSICMEILTNKAWSPANTIESLIISIRAQLIAGGARLDRTNRYEYSIEEAKIAFNRMLREHEWD